MKEGFPQTRQTFALLARYSKKGVGNLCICLEIHQVSTKYHPKYDIFPILFYCTQRNHSNFKFYSNFTKLDLVKSAKVKVQNAVKTFHELKLQNQQTPVVKSRISISLPKTTGDF